MSGSWIQTLRDSKNDGGNRESSLSIDDRYREEITPREREVLFECSNGLSSKEIGAKLFLAEETVKFYRKNIIRKMNASNITQCVADAIRKGVIE